MQPVTQLVVAQRRRGPVVTEQTAGSRIGGVAGRRLLGGILPAITLSLGRLHRLAHLVLQPAAQVRLLQQAAAGADGVNQLTVVQLRHVAGRPDVLGAPRG